MEVRGTCPPHSDHACARRMLFSRLYDNMNPFTEQIVGEWALPDEVTFFLTPHLRQETHILFEPSRGSVQCVNPTPNGRG